MELSELTTAVRVFTDDREWQQFHSPKNLLLALTGEAGELAELFQWLTEDEAAAFVGDPKHEQRAKEELADILYFVLRLAYVFGIDLSLALMDKLEANALKYPVERVRGSAAKYTAYEK